MGGHIDYTQYFQTSKILENLSNIECMDEDLITLINMMSEEATLAARAECVRSLEYVKTITCNLERAAKNSAKSTHLAKIKCTYPACE